MIASKTVSTWSKLKLHGMTAPITPDHLLQIARAIQGDVSAIRETMEDIKQRLSSIESRLDFGKQSR